MTTAAGPRQTRRTRQAALLDDVETDLAGLTTDRSPGQRGGTADPRPRDARAWVRRVHG